MAAAKHWIVSGDGQRYPTRKNPEFNKWHDAYQKQLELHFGGKGIRLEHRSIPVTNAIPNNHVANPDRFEAYKRMLKLGEPLPPVVAIVHPNDPAGTFNIIDGSHRWHAARELGIKNIPAILVHKDQPIRKSEGDLPKNVQAMMEKVRMCLTDDLRAPKYQGDADPHAGHCYVASEALYHMLGGAEAGWKPQHIRHEDEPHWYLRHRTGLIADPTADQFKTPVPHGEGIGKGFLTRQPSKRAQKLMARLQTLEKALTIDIQAGKVD